MAVAGDTLRVYTLETGKEVPKATAPVPTPANFQWKANGNELLFRDERVGVMNPDLGKQRTLFTPKYPHPPLPKLTSNKLPAPDTPDSSPAPEWDEDGTVLSEDGTRLLGFILRDNSATKVRNHSVVVWDVPTGRLLGTVALPDEPYVPGVPRVRGAAPLKPNGARKTAQLVPNEKKHERFAVSEDGKRVAIGDAAGVVRVYDIANPKTDGGVAGRPAAADEFAVGTVWKGEKHRNETNKTMPAALKVTERDGKRFKGELTLDANTVNVVAGTLTADGKIVWDTTEVVKGATNQPVAGTLDGTRIAVKFAVTVRSNGKSYTATGTIKLSKSE